MDGLVALAPGSMAAIPAANAFRVVSLNRRAASSTSPIATVIATPAFFTVAALARVLDLLADGLMTPTSAPLAHALS